MAAKRKKISKQTLSEFRAWLEGVEEISGSDWIPDKGQWKLIRDRIDNIVEPEPMMGPAMSGNIANPMNPHAVQQQRAPGATPHPSEFIPPAPVMPTAFDRAGVPEGAAVAPGGVPLPAGIPPGTAFAQPDASGLLKSTAPGGRHSTDGAAFE